MYTILSFLIFIYHISVTHSELVESIGITDNWQTRHQNLLNQTKYCKNDVKAVFLGDSITEGWLWYDWGLELWTRYYASRGAYNYGVSGDTVENVLYRINHAELDGLNPRVIVLMIGTNNIGRNNDSYIVEAIQSVVTVLQKKLPKARIILMGILPREGSLRDRSVENINSDISKTANINFLDLGSKFRASVGSVKSSVYRNDRLHINADGYGVWSDSMQSIYDKLLMESK